MFNPILSIKSGKIVGKWEGRPSVLQIDYLGRIPIVFPGGAELVTSQTTSDKAKNIRYGFPVDWDVLPDKERFWKYLVDSGQMAAEVTHWDVFA